MTTTENGGNAAAVTEQAAGICGRAMLVSLTVSAWSARRFDRQVTDEVNREHAASRDAGRYNKHLFADAAPTHKAACAAAGAVRGVFYTQTLPWSDEGWRLLPSANYFAFTEAMRRARSELADAVQVFVDDYPALCEQARVTLNGLWRAEDYPPVGAVAQKFGAHMAYSPVPSGSDFRLTLPDEEREAIERSVTERVREATDAAMRDAWGRLHRAVSRMYARLTARVAAEAEAGADEKRLPPIHESLVENLRETADILGRLNVTEDPALEAMRQRVLTELATVNGRALRKDSATREDAAKRAGAILDAMADFYGGGAAGAMQDFYGGDADDERS